MELLEQAVDDLHLILVQLLPCDFCLKDLKGESDSLSSDFASLFISHGKHNWSFLQVMHLSESAASSRCFVLNIHAHLLMSKVQRACGHCPTKPMLKEEREANATWFRDQTRWEKLNQSLHRSLSNVHKPEPIFLKA